MSERLENIFQIVSPDIANLEIYGHEIYNLLLLACTEFESQCKGLLRAHSYVFGAKPSTADYVKLCKPLRLDQYTFELAAYPARVSYQPFAQWDTALPTRSIVWYDIYNQVKHDREVNFPLGTLFHAIEAVAACAALVESQFGVFGRGERPHVFERVFKLVKRPMWRPGQYFHAPRTRTEAWEAVCLSF